MIWDLNTFLTLFSCISPPEPLANQIVLDVLRFFLKSREDQAFAVVSLTLRDTLLLAVLTANSLFTFKTLSKMVFFTLAFAVTQPLLLLLIQLLYASIFFRVYCSFCFISYCQSTLVGHWLL